MASCAAAVSSHPDAAHALGEVAGQVLDGLGGSPDLALVFVSGPHLRSLDLLTSAVRTLVRPGLLVGAGASGVLGGRTEVEDGPALALWGARLRGRATAVRLAVHASGAGHEVRGLPAEPAAAAATLVLLADPAFPVQPFAEGLRDDFGHLVLAGGLASTGGADGPPLLLDGSVHRGGAVGVLLEPADVPRTVVSQGCRPVGEPWVVTAGGAGVIAGLGGRPALDRLLALADDLSPHDRALLGSLQCGLALDESCEHRGPGDFLVRPVLGADRATGAIAVAGEVEIGRTVQFLVRDGDSAADDLQATLAGLAAAAPLAGALVFTCNGRGRALFGRPHQDAGAVADVTPGGAVAGMFCAEEIGPVGGRNLLHSSSATVLGFGP